MRDKGNQGDGGSPVLSGAAVPAQSPKEAPPSGSRLAASLEHGIFAKSFTSCEAIGKGGFGEVVKAWHIESQQWYAVKFIPVWLKAGETVDDDDKAWCGAELFERLCQIRCPHVLRYHRRWTELFEDVRGALPKSSRLAQWPGQSPASDPAAGATGGPLWSVERRAATARSRYVSHTTEQWNADSDGGFEWEMAGVSTRGTDQDASSQPQHGGDQTAVEASPSKRYQVMLLIQMEYYEGMTLNGWLANPRLRSGLSSGSLEGTLGLFEQLATGLAELHQEGIVHRDVKPENIIVSTLDGRIKIIDFGLSRLRSAPVQKRPRGFGGDHSLTAVGTPGYAPPEQCCSPKGTSEAGGCPSAEAARCSADAQPCADVFSAGIVLVELLMAALRAGPAWRTAMERAAAMRKLHGGQGASLPAELLRTQRISGWLRQLVTRMLSPDPEVRPSAQQVLHELAAGRDSRERHNPYLDPSPASSPMLASAIEPIAALGNPYVGFFLDHRQKVLEGAVDFRL